MNEVEDEKKPFAETTHDEDLQPDPEEILMLNQGHGKVWMVKIPKSLLERWTAINAEDMHLASLRIYTDPGPGQKARIILFLPQHKDPVTPPNPNWPVFGPNAVETASEAEPDCYELEMVNDSVDNHIVVAERPKDASFGLSSNPSAPPNPRARTTILTGRIKHDCFLRPSFSARYRRQMRERHKKYNTPQRQIQMIENTGISGGGIKRLTSGVGAGGAGSAFRDLVAVNKKPAKGQFERMARMPRNQLLDALFALFRDIPRWKTQQPEAYLKEVLSEIAFLHRSGEHNGLWEVKDTFKEEGIKGENFAGPSSLGDDVKMEGVDGFEEDDEEDEDMEEVS
ncbi:transcription initiation factor IIF, beta subunit-domain-containing protein [Rhodocollybia butyracea]|uniref:Transcription initiation factor IIF subunit beta n=1 Tax=Rhodocollybia butyracea TaxID=206335 RepID=A0A9P5U2P8_9AGAR|nr:transcription initiation factor IIF, beta subunit-domain-containing protein [Rhodocollybia butyracea]